jgi:hypothetical protein
MVLGLSREMDTEITITLLTEYQVVHMQEVFSSYRRALTRELNKHFQSKKRKEYLKEKLTITDEIMSSINVLESEAIFMLFRIGHFVRLIAVLEEGVE